MQLGCGLAVREIKGHRYLYFWSYEGRAWGSIRRWTYVGRVARPETRTRAQKLLLDHYDKARREMERRIRALQDSLV